MFRRTFLRLVSVGWSIVMTNDNPAWESSQRDADQIAETRIGPRTFTDSTTLASGANSTVIDETNNSGAIWSVKLLSFSFDGTHSDDIEFEVRKKDSLGTILARVDHMSASGNLHLPVGFAVDSGQELEVGATNNGSGSKDLNTSVLIRDN